MNENEITSKQIWFGIFLVVLLIGGYIGADFLLSYLGKIKNSDAIKVEQIKQNVADIQKSLAPYDYKEKLNQVVIITNFENSSKENKPTDSFTKKLVTEGKFAKGYLYVKASVDGKALTKDDDIYTKISGTIAGNYQELGGHLISSKGLETPMSDKFTELLFDMSDIKYKSSYIKNNNEAVSGDWLNILNSGNASTNVVIGFSSTARTGNIVILSIYYKCIEGTNCSIVVK